MKYNVSYILDDITHANLADANSPIAVTAWYKMRHPDAHILDVRPATADDDKPGKPCVRIPMNVLPYMNAAENISCILQREKGMTCVFYVMDNRYYKNLALPQFSADNRGHQLVVGDWYVIVTCGDGYKYYINVTADSVVTMCAEVFDFLQYK